MAEVKARIGFVSGGTSSMPHYNSFLPIVPKEIEIDFQGLELYGKSLYEIADKRNYIVGRVKEFVAEREMEWRDSHRRADRSSQSRVFTMRLKAALSDSIHHRAQRLRGGAARLLGAASAAAHAVRRASQ